MIKVADRGNLAWGNQLEQSTGELLSSNFSYTFFLLFIHENYLQTRSSKYMPYLMGKDLLDIEFAQCNL